MSKPYMISEDAFLKMTNELAWLKVFKKEALELAKFYSKNDFTGTFPITDLDTTVKAREFLEKHKVKNEE